MQSKLSPIVDILHRTLNLLYLWVQNFSLTKMREQTLQIFQQKSLQKIFGPRKYHQKGEIRDNLVTSFIDTRIVNLRQHSNNNYSCLGFEDL
jgi:hypothetical protein